MSQAPGREGGQPRDLWAAAAGNQPRGKGSRSRPPGSPLGYPRGLERILLQPAHAGFLRSLFRVSAQPYLGQRAGCAGNTGISPRPELRGCGECGVPAGIARGEGTTRLFLFSPPPGPSRGSKLTPAPEHPRHEAQLLSAPEGLQPQLLVSSPAECCLGASFPFASAQPEGGGSPSSQLDHDPILPPGSRV